MSADPAGTRGTAGEAERRRLDRLRAYDLDAGQRLSEFDELAALAARLCEAPVAFVNVVAEDTVWSLGAYPADAATAVQVWPREVTLCTRLVGSSEDLVIADVRRDLRVADWVLAASGEVPYAFYAGAPLRDGDGHVLGTVCVLGGAPRELSADALGALRLVRNQAVRLLSARHERVTLEAGRSQLAERQEAFEEAMEIAGETFWDWNLLTNEMDQARYRSRMLGYGTDEVSKHLNSWVDLSHPDDREPVAALVRAHLRGETPEYEAEYRQRHRDGHWIWVRSRGRVVARDAATGKPTRMRGTSVDITRRKRLEDQIAQLNEDLLQLVRSLPDAVLHTDLEGRWLFANDRARALFGHLEGAAPDATDRLAWERRTVQVSLETHHFAVQPREYEVQRVPIFQASGQPKGMVRIARDLLHQREQEDILRRALEAAEEAARSKTQFLATMAHEIRTPLNSVVGAARLALMEEEPHRREEHLQFVNQAAQMLLDLLNTVLDHSRLEQGSLPMEQAPVSVRHLIHQVSQQLAPAARAKGLQWTTRVDPAVPVMVIGDHIRLRQVLTNLAGNAVKFTDNGSITVQARIEPAADEGRPARVEIAVIDTGIGLTREQQGRLFKAFSQADASIARRYGGTGLGLSISRQIMQALGGSLALQSERGLGSTFVLSWPLRPVVGNDGGTELGPEAPANGTDGAAPLPERGPELARQLSEAGREMAGRRVLVVDDNRMNVAVVRRLLERAGIAVITAAGGPEALDILRTESVDLVLLDLYMPEMNGDDVARCIRGELGLQRLPVVALSASVTLEERERCAAAGMDDFVSKPIDPLELLSAMADCLQP